MTIERLGNPIRVLFRTVRLLGSERWSAPRIERLQRELLVRQLRYGVTHIPFYRQLGIDPEEIAGFEDLSRFPKLTKSIVQRETPRLRNRRIMSGRTFRSSTSGSSGEPTTTWFDLSSWLLCKYALKIRRTLTAGIPFGQRLLIFDETARADGSVPAPRVIHYGLFREMRLSVFTPLEAQYEATLRLRPTAIYGSPSGVKELCDHALERGLPLPRVGTIFLASELIGEALRRRLEAAFDGRVVGIYGSTEFKEIAHECRARRYHVNFESVYLETEREPGQEVPRLLVTSLVNRAMPLIRFDIGDYARIGADPCLCGRQSPYLTDLAGREAEFVELRDGRRISPYRLTTAVETTEGLLKYQFYQEAHRGLSLHVVLSDHVTDPDGAIDELRVRLTRVLGPEIPVDVRRVTSITRTAAGKHKIVARAS